MHHTPDNSSGDWGCPGRAICGFRSGTTNALKDIIMLKQQFAVLNATLSELASSYIMDRIFLPVLNMQEIGGSGRGFCSRLHDQC